MWPNCLLGIAEWDALLANERARPWAVFLLIGAAVLALIVWGQQEWMPAFPRYPITGITNFNRSRLFYLIGAIIAVSIVLAADLRYLAAPKATFGIAGGLWLASIGLLLCAAFAGSQLPRDVISEPHVTPWTNWEIVILAPLTFVALFTRVWDLARFPDNIYPDEIMTGTIATQSYINKIVSALQFSALWNRPTCAVVLDRVAISQSGWQHSCDAKAARCFIRRRDVSSVIRAHSRNMGKICRNSGNRHPGV